MAVVNCTKVKTTTGKMALCDLAAALKPFLNTSTLGTDASDSLADNVNELLKIFEPAMMKLVERLDENQARIDDIMAQQSERQTRIVATAKDRSESFKLKLNEL